MQFDAAEIKRSPTLYINEKGIGEYIRSQVSDLASFVR